MDPSLQTPWKTVPAERTMRSKISEAEVGSLLQREHHNVVYCKLTRMFVCVNRKIRL
jgi:hypothetical protein